MQRTLFWLLAAATVGELGKRRGTRSKLARAVSMSAAARLFAIASRPTST